MSNVIQAVRKSLGLSLLVWSTVVSIVMTVIMLGSMFLLAGGDPSGGAAATVGIVMIVGFIVLSITGLAWWIGLILAIIEYVKGKKAEAINP